MNMIKCQDVVSVGSSRVALATTSAPGTPGKIHIQSSMCQGSVNVCMCASQEGGVGRGAG